MLRKSGKWLASGTLPQTPRRDLRVCASQRDLLGPTDGWGCGQQRSA